MEMSVCWSALLLCADENIPTTVEWIAKKCCTDILIPLRINCNHFVDPDVSSSTITGSKFQFVQQYFLN